MSLESVFSVISGWVMLGERFTLQEAIGCVLMFTAVILAQVNIKRKGDSRFNRE
jgi:drug/metabolite transporter (DMT)-like permease